MSSPRREGGGHHGNFGDEVQYPQGRDFDQTSCPHHGEFCVFGTLFIACLLCSTRTKGYVTALLLDTWRMQHTNF